jgi:hypothetical protein
LVQTFKFSRRDTHRQADTPSNIKVLSQRFERLQCRYYWWEEFMMHAIEMGSGGMIYIQRFMKIGTGVQAILRFYLRNLRGCNVGITDGKDL